MYLRSLNAALLAMIVSTACFSLQAGQRAVVSVSGSDANVANGCTITNPCRSFAAAHTAVDPGGEIIALDAAGFGPVTITKSVSIIANPGAYAGISVASGNGITIATAGVVVSLRGLRINGLGGSNGVVMTNGASLSISDCSFSGFTSGFGVLISTPANVQVVDSTFRGNNDGLSIESGANADVRRSAFTGNQTYGMIVTGVSATPTRAVVIDSDISQNGWGLFVIASTGNVARVTVSGTSASSNTNAGFYVEGASTAVLTVGNSVATHNFDGFRNGAASIFQSLGNNLVRHNVSLDVSGTVTVISGT